MSRYRELRDPVHGFIRIEDRECDVVDSPAFQRLRRIRQLAMAYLVYPGATHSRFEHSLGVVHVAGLMCHKLGIDQAHTRLIRLAALVHDIGHGPFSHVSEEVYDALGTNVDGGDVHKIHEFIGQQVIRNDDVLRKCISERDAEEVLQLLKGGLDQPLYRSVISGPLDADKQDYLLRDSYYCGVRYGLYDLPRLHGVLGVDSNDAGQFLVVDEDGVPTLEQFVLARYYLTTQVIAHKGRRISDAMLIRALTLGVATDGLRFLKKLYTFEPTGDFYNEFMRWNDERLVTHLLEPEHAATWAGKIARRLAERRLFKLVVRRDVASVDGLAVAPGGIDDIRGDLEASVAEELSKFSPEPVDRAEVVVQIVKAQPARKSEGPLLVRNGRGGFDTLDDRSVIFGPINQKLQARYLECYAPIAEIDEQGRQKLYAKIDELLLERVAKLLSSTPPDTAETSSEETS